MRIARIAVPAILAMAASMALAVTPALASSPSGKTVTFHRQVDEFTDVVPCTSIPADITTTSNGVEHFTMHTLGDGTPVAQGTFTQTGTFTAVRLDGSVTYAGQFTSWFGFSAFNPVFDSEGNIVSADHFETSGTFHIHGSGSDGSVIDEHNNEHFGQNPVGNIAQHFHDSCAA